MSEKTTIKIIGIGNVGKRLNELGGADHLSLDRDASKVMIDEAVSGADMLWIAADAADSKLVAEIGGAASGALRIALLKGSPEPDILSLFDSVVDAYTYVSRDDEFEKTCAAASAISGLVSEPGNVNVDIADVNYIFRHAGRIIIGIGEGKDVNDAARAALSSINLHKDLEPAERVLYRIDSDTDVGIEDIQKASDIIREAASPDVLMLWGHVGDPDLHGRAKIVIAAGFKPIP